MIPDFKMVCAAVWGASTQFADFETFKNEMDRRGVGALEMLAIEMKASGTYVSRSLGFKHAEFSTVEADLSEADMAGYDAAVTLWNDVRRELQVAIEAAGLDQKVGFDMSSAVIPLPRGMRTSSGDYYHTRRNSPCAVGAPARWW